MKENFNVVVLYNFSSPHSDDEIAQMLIDQIPNIEKFAKYYVTGDD